MGVEGPDHRDGRVVNREQRQDRGERRVHVQDVEPLAGEDLAQRRARPGAAGHPGDRPAAQERARRADPDHVLGPVLVRPGRARHRPGDDLDDVPEPSRLAGEAVDVLRHGAVARVVVLGDDADAHGAPPSARQRLLARPLERDDARLALPERPQPDAHGRAAQQERQERERGERPREEGQQDECHRTRRPTGEEDGAALGDAAPLDGRAGEAQVAAGGRW